MVEQTRVPAEIGVDPPEKLGRLATGPGLQTLDSPALYHARGIPAFRKARSSPGMALLLQRDLTRRSSLVFGAGLLDIDYEDGSGSKLFAYDVRHQGAIVALNFSF